MPLTHRPIPVIATHDPPPPPHPDHQKRHTWRDHERGGHPSYLLHRDVLALRIAWCQGDDSQSQQNRFAGSLTWDWNGRNLNERLLQEQ